MEIDYDIKIKTSTKSDEIIKKYFKPKHIKLKVCEVHKHSIVTKSFVMDEKFKPSRIIFCAKKHKKHFTKVLDVITTPEITILYTDKDISKWSYSKGCILIYDPLYMIYTGE